MEHISMRTFKASRCKRCGIVVGFGEHCDWCQRRPTGHVDAPGNYQGRHHSEWIGTIQVLIDEDDVYALQTLLPRLAAAAAAEAAATGQPGNGWIDDQLERLERRRFGTPSGSRDTDAA